MALHHIRDTSTALHHIRDSCAFVCLRHCTFIFTALSWRSPSKSTAASAASAAEAEAAAEAAASTKAARSPGSKVEPTKDTTTAM